MSYIALKHLHLTAVVLSLSFFALRGAWMLADSPLLKKKPVRILPHVIDTVLLVSALLLAAQYARIPEVPHAWLAAKVVGLVVYIGLGVLAFRGRTKGTRTVAFVAALAVAAYIVAVALAKQVIPGA